MIQNLDFINSHSNVEQFIFKTQTRVYILAKETPILFKFQSIHSLI